MPDGVDLLGDPLLVNGCWVCLVAGALLLVLGVHDARFSDTRWLRRVAIVLLAVGAGLAVGDVVFAFQPLPSVW